MSNNLSRKILLLGGIIILGLLLLVLIVKTKQQPAPTPLPETQPPADQTTVLPAPELATVNVPAISFASFKTPESSVEVPSKVKAYTFRNDYSLPFVSMVGQKLGLTESKSEGNSVILYNLDEQSDKRGYLTFNTVFGNYEYASYGTFPLPGQGTVNQKVRSYLLELGLIDETVDCDISYQRKDIANVNFVECHRNWEKTGLPIINFGGLLNIPDITTVKDLKVGMVDDLATDNPNIINVSTGQNGKERPSDFNTVTVAVDSQGNLLRITSNLKMIESTIEFTENDMLTPQEAINRFRDSNSLLTLIVPTDENAAWETVFPDNTAYDLNAEVKDFILTYIENPFGGKSLTPMYLTQGTAKTTDGYNVKFLQAIPALITQQSLSGEVAGLMALVIPTDDPSLKLKTFNPEQRTQTVQQTASPCVPAENQLSPIVSLGELGMLGQWNINAPSPEHKSDQFGQFAWFRSGRWYLIPPPGQSLPEINQIMAAFQSLNLPERGGYNPRELDALQNEWNKFNFCPLRVSGGSPTLLGYGKPDTVYSIKVGRSIVYLNTNNDNSIYYEYQPVSFLRPSTGWIVDKDNLDNLAGKIAKQLNLTSQESSKLAFELNLAASKVVSKKLFVGPVPQTEVDSKIPLSVTPQVPVIRYHFYVSDSVGRVTAPTIKPLVRTAEMILELGAAIPKL